MPADETDMTELYDADFPRVDLVKQGANGVPRFLIAKSQAGAGLLDPATVRDLIAKQDGQPGGASGDDRVTVTGSPGAIAKMISDAAGRASQRAEEIAKSMDAYPDDPVEVAKAKAAYDVIVKAKYSAEDRRKMASSGAAMDDGSYPIEDEEDLRNAIHAVGRGGSSHNAIRKHIIKRARSLGKSSMIPDNWAADGSLKEKVSKDMGPELDDADSVADMDATVPLAEPDGEAPGDPTDPGSPAWEAIDAATAQKWISIAVRLKNALCVMAEREMIEAASADPDDAMAAFDLQDAQCAVDFVIDTLACFAADEQAEAELGAEMQAIGKAMAGMDTAPLGQFEALTAVAKAGRVLSGANEALIRQASENLQRVLSSLPAPIEKESGHTAGDKEASMPQPETSAAATADAGQEPAMGTAPVEKTAADPAPAEPAGPAGAEPVAKADGDKAVTVVYNQSGQLIGIVDPSDITPVSNSEAEPDDDGGAGDGVTGADGGGSTPEPATAPAGDGDMTPAPPASEGEPAEGVAKENGTMTIDRGELESLVAKAVEAALGTQSAAHQEEVAKMAAERDGLAEKVGQLEDRLVTVEKQPAAPKVFTSGQVPPREHLRGQDKGAAATTVDVAKAGQLKKTLYTGTAAEQNAAFGEMQQMAVAGLAAMHAAGPAGQ